MNCVNCTQPLIEGSRFCNNCGVRVEQASAIKAAPARDLLQNLVNQQILTGMIAPNTYGEAHLFELVASGNYAQAETDFNTDPFDQRPKLVVTAITEGLDSLSETVSSFNRVVEGNLLGYVVNSEAVVFVSADYSRDISLENGIGDLEKALKGVGTVLMGEQGATPEDVIFSYGTSQELLTQVRGTGFNIRMFKLPASWASELGDGIECSLFRYYPVESNDDLFISGSIYVGVPGKEVQINGATECVATLTDENWTIELSANRMAPSQFKVEIAKFENYLGGTLEIQR